MFRLIIRLVETRSNSTDPVFQFLTVIPAARIPEDDGKVEIHA